MRAGWAPPLAMVMLVLTAVVPASAANFRDLAFRPHPGGRLPLDAQLRDEHGRAVPLARFFTGEPVMLVLEYLHCKTLCGLALGALATALDRVPLDAGQDFQVVAVSIDPRDTPPDAAAAKAEYLAIYRHKNAAAGWHFLTGPRAAVERIAAAIGFPYRYDAVLDQYMHPVGFVVAAGDGTISRYLLEIDPTPAVLQTALADAAHAEVQGPLTRFVLWCHGADPLIGRYTVPILAAFTIANLGAMGGAVIVFGTIWRRRHS